MNLKEMTDALLFWVSQWAGVALPLAVAMVVGLAICAAAVTALWTRRIGAAPGVVCHPRHVAVPAFGEEPFETGARVRDRVGTGHRAVREPELFRLRCQGRGQARRVD